MPRFKQGPSITEYDDVKVGDRVMVAKTYVNVPLYIVSEALTVSRISRKGKVAVKADGYGDREWIVPAVGLRRIIEEESDG